MHTYYTTLQKCQCCSTTDLCLFLSSSLFLSPSFPFPIPPSHFFSFLSSSFLYHFLIPIHSHFLFLYISQWNLYSLIGLSRNLRIKWFLTPILKRKLQFESKVSQRLQSSQKQFWHSLGCWAIAVSLHWYI